MVSDVEPVCPAVSWTLRVTCQLPAEENMWVRVGVVSGERGPSRKLQV